jgi:transposase
MKEADWSKVLGWPGYRVYQHEIDEPGKKLKLWVRRERGNRKLICSGCGRKLAEAYDSYEREVRDLPCFEFRTTVVVELYRVRCPDCGMKTEKVPQLPSKAPFSKRFEEAVGLACESAGVRRVALQFGLSSSTALRRIKNQPNGLDSRRACAPDSIGTSAFAIAYIHGRY